MLPEKSPTEKSKKLRVPEQIDDIQVNCCKNPQCKNFLIPVQQGIRGKGRGKKQGGDPNYTMSSVGKDIPGYKCKGCKEVFAAKSNQGIAKEVERISTYIEEPPEPSCTNPDCINHGKGAFSNPELYYSHGYTDRGSLRFRCLAEGCEKTFTFNEKPVTRQKNTHLNSILFRLLMNKVPFNRILEITQISKPVLYRRIDFFHEQCQKFIGKKERNLLTGKLKLDRLYLSTDRQSYHSNWGDKKTRKHIQLMGIGTADNKSRYVFPLTVNFDERYDPKQIQEDFESMGDLEQESAFREHAQYWMKDEFEEAVKETLAKKEKKYSTKLEKDRQDKLNTLKAIINEIEERHDTQFTPQEIEFIFESQQSSPYEDYLLDHAKQEISEKESESIETEIQKAYEKILQRDDTEVSEEFDDSVQLPNKGMQVHAEYTMYGNFYFLKKLFKHVEKVRFYLDQESGIRAAFMNAFGNRVKARTADAWYIKYLKDLVIDKKYFVLNKTKAKVRAYKKLFPQAAEKEIHIALIKEELQRVKSFGKWKDKWVHHPIAKLYEPEKSMCWLTDMNDYDVDHQANLFYKASAHGIDGFFMQARRRLSIIERPIKTASSVGRSWYGYSPYNPAIIQKLLDIFRVYYNYCLKSDKDNKTPAMRLGLAKGVIRVEDLFYE